MSITVSKNWTPTRRPAQQGHRPPCRRTAQQRACQRPCPRTGRTPMSTCTTGTSTTKPRRDSNGHVSSLVQELHGHHERPQSKHRHVNNLVEELHNATSHRPHLPHHFGAPWTDVIKTVVSLHTVLWGPRVRGSLSRRKRLQTVESSGQELPRECRPSSDQHAAPADPLLAPPQG